MRILVVGASNSIAPAGYLVRAKEILAGFLGREVEITNISVGGTSVISGISRVFDLPAGADFDLVLYEYAINNASHFTMREPGEAIVAGALQLLVGVLAERFPDAVFAPVTFALEPDFSANQPGRIYDVERALWTACQNPHLDLRQRLSYLFAQRCPDWLYSDIAHYSSPHGTDLVGSMVGRFLAEVSGETPRRKLADLNARMLALPQALPVRARHLSAEDLAEHAYGDFEIVTRSNSLMTQSALRLRPGGGVRLAERPFNIALLSDRRHDWVRVTKILGARQQSWALRTRFTGVDNPQANPPDKDRFFYSGIPLAFLLRPGAVFTRDRSAFEFEVEPDPATTLDVMYFDGFPELEGPPPADRRLDIAGMTLLADA